MKQLIVLFATIVLGIALFQMIAGDRQDSVYSVVRHAFMQEIDRY